VVATGEHDLALELTPAEARRAAALLVAAADLVEKVPGASWPIDPQ
jgi:hypothetical protein